MKSISGKKHRLTMLLAAFLVVLLFTGYVPPVDAAGEVATEPVTVFVGELPGGRNCPGAAVQLLSEDGTVLEEFESVSGGYVIQSDLIIGEKYTLHQLTPADDRLVEFPYAEQLNYNVSYCIGFDTEFTIVRNESTGKEEIRWSRYRHTIRRLEGETLTGVTAMNTQTGKKIVSIEAARSRTVEFGMETLGNAADPDEYFEVILEIPDGVPGQVMNADLSNADAEKNPAQLTIPESGSLTTSFWLKDGQSIVLDGFPLLFGDYYSLSENNDTLNEEGYITRILADEDIDQAESDDMIVQGIELLSKVEAPKDAVPLFYNPFTPFIAYAGTEVVSDAITAMTGYATKELLTVEDPVVDPSEHMGSFILDTLGMARKKGSQPYSINDTLSDRTGTTRTASKRGFIPGDNSEMLVPYNGVYGDGYVLFINRRDGVAINKVDEAGEPLAGSKLEILSADGESVHEFTSEKDGTTLVALAPGEYTLKEVEPPAGYLPADDVTFTVVDHETVQVAGETVDAVTMVDVKAPEPISVTITKVWSDKGHEDERPSAEDFAGCVTLYRNGEATDEVGTVKDNGDGTYTITFDELVAEDETGKAYEYTVKETGIPEGYEIEGEDEAENEGTITNVFKVEPVSVTITKVWSDKGHEGERPSAREFAGSVTLYRNGEATDEVGTVKDNGDGTFTITFEDLAAEDENGKTYEYTVKETKVPEGYEIDGDAEVENEGTITNVFKVEPVSVTITKVWSDKGNESKRPSAKDFAGCVTLYRNGEATDEVGTVKDNGDGTYTITFEDLAAEDENGKAYEYTVKETKVPDGYKIDGDAEAKDGGKITNTYESKPEDPNEPDKPADPDQPGTNDNGGPVQTGDTSDAGTAAAAFILALSALIGLTAAHRRKNN